MADEDLLAPPSKDELAAAGFKAQEMNPPDDSDLTKPLPKAQVSETGRTVEPMPVWQKGFQVLTDRLIQGGAQFTEAGAGWRLIGGAEMKDVDPDVEALKLDELNQHRQDFVNTHGYNLFKLKDLPFSDSFVPDENKNDVVNALDIPGAFVESIPMMGLTVGAGWGGGAAAATIFGEGAALAIGGATIGAPVVAGALGAAALAGMVMAGSHVYQSMKRGVPKQQAITSGLIAGAVGGIATSIGQGALGHMVGGAAETVLANQGARNAVGKLAAMYFKNVGIDASAQTIQTAVDATLTYVDTNKAHSKNAMSLKELMLTIASGGATALATAPVFGAATHGLGVMSAETALKAHAQAMEQITEHLKQQAREEQINAARKERDNIARDISTKAATEQAQLRARKSLRGYIEINQAADIGDAQQAYLDAKEQHKIHKTEDTRIALYKAKAELDHALYSDQLNAIEEALTSPNMMADLAAQVEELNNQIEVLKEQKSQAETNEEKQALAGAIERVQTQLKRVKQLQDLGSHEAVKAKVEEFKNQISAHVEETKRKRMLANLEGSIAKRQKEADQLRAEIRADKKEARDEGESVRTKGRRKKLEKLRAKIEFEKEILSLAQSDFLGAGDIKKLTPDAPTSRLVALAEIAKEKIEKAAKLSGSAKAKEMRAARKLLSTIIDFSRLDKNDKTALKARFAMYEGDQFLAAFADIQDEIKTLFKKRRLEAARKDLNRQLDSLSVDPTIKSKYPGVEEQLMTLKHFIEDDEAIPAMLDEMANKVDLTEEDLQKIELSKLFPKPYAELSAHQIEAILDTMIELKETGRAEALRSFEERKARQAKKDAIFTQRLGAGRKQKPGLKGAIDKILADKVGSQIKSFRGLMVMISQFGEAHAMDDIFDVKGAFSAAHKMRIKWEARFVKLLEDHGVSKKRWAKFIIEGNRKVQGDIYYQDVVGEAPNQQLVSRKLEKPDGTPYTHWELIQIRNYLLDTDPRAVKHLREGNRFSYPNQVQPHESTLEVVEYYIDHNQPDWEPVANAMRAFYRTDEFGSVVNETIERRYGRSMPANETYGGQLFSDIEGPVGREVFTRMSNRPGSTKTRKGGAQRIVIKSAIENLQSHINQYSHEHAFFELEQDMPVILGSQETKDYIRRNIGEDTVTVLDKFVKDIVFGQRKARDTAEKAGAYFTEMLHSQYLAGRVEQIPKQATGAIHAMQKVGPKAAIEGWLTMLADKHALDAYVESSGLAQARKQGRLPSTDPGLRGKLSRFNHWLSAYVKVGDEFGSFGAAYPVYLDTLKRTGDHKLAVKEADLILDTTQSSTSIDEQPHIFRLHSFVRMLGFMAQEPTRQVEAIHTAELQYRAGKVPAAHVHRIKFITYAGAFLYSFVGYLWRYPLMTDKKREEQLNYLIDIAPLGPYSGIALLGQYLTFAEVNILKTVFNQKTKAYEPELLPGDPFLDTADFTVRTAKLFDGKETAAEGWNWIISAAKLLSDVTGLPIRAGLNIIEPGVPGAHK